MLSMPQKERKIRQQGEVCVGGGGGGREKSDKKGEKKAAFFRCASVLACAMQA